MLVKIKVIYNLKFLIIQEHKTKTFQYKKRKRNTLKSLNALYEDREIIVNGFRSGIFPLKRTEGTGNPDMLASVAEVFDRSRLKILKLKQMFQSLPIALAQVKAGNTSENLLNKIRQVIYPLYQAILITQKYITIQ